LTNKDLHSFLKRRGEDVSEEEAENMIKHAEFKVSSVDFDSKDKRKRGRNKLDYRMFKTYLLASSFDSQDDSLLDQQSSLRFSEYAKSIARETGQVPYTNIGKYCETGTSSEDENDRFKDHKYHYQEPKEKTSAKSKKSFHIKNKSHKN